MRHNPYNPGLAPNNLILLRIAKNELLSQHSTTQILPKLIKRKKFISIFLLRLLVFFGYTHFGLSHILDNNHEKYKHVVATLKINK